MSGLEQQRLPVSKFPLVGPDTSETTAFIAIVRRLSIARSLPEIMEIVTHAARTLLGADGITFVLREGDQCYYAEEDAISPLWKGRRFPMSACISGWCMIERRSAVIPDIYQDQRIPHDAYRPTFVRSLLMVPVRQDEPIAAMGAYWANTREFSAAEVELLQSIANAAALAVAYVDLQERKRRVRPRWIAAGLKSLPRLRQPNRAAVPAGTAAEEPERSWWRTGLRENSIEAFGFAVLCVVLAAAARFALGSLIDGEVLPLGTFYPAVLMASLIAGVAPGVLALVLGGLTGWWAFMVPYFSFTVEDTAQVVSLAIYVASAVIIIIAAERHRQVTRALDSKDRERQLLSQELQHRVRNTTAVVQAIISRELRGDTERASNINRRIAALATTDDLLTSDEAVPGDLRAILLSALAPYGTPRFSLAGDDIRLAPECAKALSLVVHEFATNAAKYGALSVADGRVSVSWVVSGHEVRMIWQEFDGPPLPPVRRRGFGTYFIERMLAAIGGTIQTEWRKPGIIHELRFGVGLPEQ